MLGIFEPWGNAGYWAREIMALADETDIARRLQTIRGIGPSTALAVEAFALDLAQFK